MSTLSAAPIGIPPLNGLWARLKSAFSKPVQATAHTPAHTHEVEVLKAQVVQLLERVAVLESPPAPAPRAVLPTDVYLAGRRYTADGVAYITTTVSGTDQFIGGARVTITGEQVVA